MADVVLGAPHTVGWLLREADGSPATTGVTGNVSLYGPASTTAVGGPDALTHFGNGVWGVTFPANEMVYAGLYKALATSISYESGTIVLANQAVYFTVGRASPAHRTLRDCVADFGVELGWALEGTSTSNGSTSTLVDSGRANSNLTSDEWIDSEILILEPNAVTDRNPVTVTGFTPASGTFTFTPTITSTTSGQDYLLLNLRGNGQNFARLKRTIVAAWREVAPTQQVVDEVNFTTDATYRLAVPSQWRGIDAVQYRWGVSGPWSDIAEAYAPYDPMLGYINFTQGIGANRQLRLVGTIDCAEPDALTSIVQVPYGWLRARVLGQLFAQSDRREDQQRAAVHLEEAARTKPRG